MGKGSSSSIGLKVELFRVFKLRSSSLSLMAYYMSDLFFVIKCVCLFQKLLYSFVCFFSKLHGVLNCVDNFLNLCLRAEKKVVDEFFSGFRAFLADLCVDGSQLSEGKVLCLLKM